MPRFSDASAADNALYVRHYDKAGLVSLVVSKTNRPLFIARPGGPFQLVDVAVSAAVYAATVGIDVRLCAQSALVTAPTLAIDAVPEKFKVSAAFIARINSLFIEKAINTAIVFTAAHVVTAAKFGAILVLMDNAGTVSTLVGEATQTTAMAYDTSAAAVAALPATPANKLRLGYIVIENNAGTWTANTDDMTAASDVTAATFVSASADTLAALTASIAPVAMSRVAGALHATYSRWSDQVGSKDIIALITTDGTAALTNGFLHTTWKGIR